MALTQEQKKQLALAALEARKKAYEPYTHFYVGAALLGRDGRIYTGCNVNNASYGAGICAERTAIFKAVSEGCREFEGIAVAGGPADAEKLDACPPCGICRQVMGEFCSGSFPVLMVTGEETWTEATLDELLPLRFALERDA